MCVSELVRLAADVCASVTKQNDGCCMMEHLEGLLGQLLGAGCTDRSRDILIPMLLKQVEPRKRQPQYQGLSLPQVVSRLTCLYLCADVLASAGWLVDLCPGISAGSGQDIRLACGQHAV